MSTKKPPEVSRKEIDPERRYDLCELLDETPMRSVRPEIYTEAVTALKQYLAFDRDDRKIRVFPAQATTITTMLEAAIVESARQGESRAAVLAAVREIAANLIAAESRALLAEISISANSSARQSFKPTRGW